MQLPSLYFTLLLSTLSTGLPFEGAKERKLLPRSKTYAVVNVDGGSSTPAPVYTTTIIDGRTKTIQVTDAVTAVATTTDTVTTTVLPAVIPVPAPSSSSTASASSASSSIVPSTPSARSSSQPTTTPTSILVPTSAPTSTTEILADTSLVTVTITESPLPTEYYDDGLWHTKYPVKTKWDWEE
ncbi:hypothetical protein BU23DRAFT_552988 [Bimuria novae-zelandiae CBS 107.79]|uniref:Uncharacterized protein n=1 Tax=Bimuria novae-zelandiae CBS 107.79 TaxID=1447943 RepID=A0A6A5VMX7_9PLEO|nr:hypothetical protein BU23DRAFT_552988 [Bimuria novae-zelandiae CBS 107.79]